MSVAINYQGHNKFEETESLLEYVDVLSRYVPCANPRLSDAMAKLCQYVKVVCSLINSR